MLGEVVACSMRSDSGVRHEGREREKNEEKRERKSIFHKNNNNDDERKW